MGLEKIQFSTTLDRPYTVLQNEDPICQLAIDRGRVVQAYVLPKDPGEIDEKLEYGGQVVHVYDHDTLYVFEVPNEIDLDPHFVEGETVDVVGTGGAIRWHTSIRLVGKKCLVSSCGRKWTHDGKMLGAYGAYSDLQLRRRIN